MLHFNLHKNRFSSHARKVRGWLYCCLYLIYGGFAFYPVMVRAENFSITGNSTFGSYNHYNGFRFRLINNSARPMTVQCKYGTALPDWNSYWGTNALGAVTGFPANSINPAIFVGGVGGNISVAAGATYDFPIACQWRGYGGITQSGGITANFPYQFRAVYQTPITYVEKIGTFSVPGIINIYPGGSTSMVPATVILGTITFTDAPSSGRISILANQDTTVQIKIGGVVVVSALELIKGYTAEWVTSTPGQYENNAPVVVTKGIGTLASGKIVKDSDGNFNLEFIFDPDDALDSEEPLEMPDADETQVPGNVPDSNESPTNVADGVTTPAQTGPDASAEPEGSTTKEMYDAVRAGVRDGMMADVNTGDPIDYKQPADTSGTDVGNAAEKVMTPLELPGGLAVPTIQSQALSIVLLGHTIAVPVPWWLAEWRGWFEFLIHVLGAMALFRLGKKAFA